MLPMMDATQQPAVTAGSVVKHVLCYRMLW